MGDKDGDFTAQAMHLAGDDGITQPHRQVKLSGVPKSVYRGREDYLPQAG